jgi:RNA polymerase sigma-70 factor (ECF subfamily)
MTASDSPAESAVSAEQTRQISEAMAQLPYPQREVIILHLLSGMKFRVIAESTGASVNTIQSRYRYGLDKLQSMLNSEVRE